MRKNLTSILGSPDTFLDALFTELSRNAIPLDGLYMDHICYRVETMAEYEYLRTELLKIGQLLSDKTIGGRPIAVIEIHDSYYYQNREISIIELPAPKKGSPYKTGYEHVEFVTGTPLESFIFQHPSIKFNLSGINKPVNRDIRLQLETGAVKFHELSLKEVIEIEEA